MTDIKKKSLIERIKAVLLNHVSINYRNIIFIVINMVISFFLAYIFNWDGIDAFIAALCIFVGFFITAKLPARQACLRILLCILIYPVVVFTSVLSSYGFGLFLVFLAVWIGFNFLCNVKKFSFKRIGYICILVFIFFRNFHIINFHIVEYGLINSALYYAVVTFILAAAQIIPYMLYVLIGRDPIKKVLLSEMFSSEIYQDREAYTTTARVLYGKDGFVNGMMDMAHCLNVINIKMHNVTEDRKYNDIGNIKKLEKEIEKLTKQTQHNIKRGKKAVLNIEPLEELASLIREKESEYSDFVTVSKLYVSVFNSINRLIEGEIEEVMSIIPQGELERISGSYKGDLKHCIRMLIAVSAGSILDLLFLSPGSVTTAMTATTTIKGSTDLSIDKIIMRICGSMAGLVFALIIVNISLYTGISAIVAVAFYLCALLLYSTYTSHSDIVAFVVISMHVMAADDSFYTKGFINIACVIAGGLISLIVTKLILPAESKTNITNDMLDIIKSNGLVMNKMIAGESADTDAIRTIDMNNRLFTSCQRVNKIYNAENEIGNIINLLNMLYDLMDSILCVKAYLDIIDYKDKNTRHEIETMEKYFSKCIRAIATNNQVEYEFDENNYGGSYELLEQNQVIEAYSQWVVHDLVIIKNTINKMINDNTFVKLNVEL